MISTQEGCAFLLFGIHKRGQKRSITKVPSRDVALSRARRLLARHYWGLPSDCYVFYHPIFLNFDTESAFRPIIVPVKDSPTAKVTRRCSHPVGRDLGDRITLFIGSAGTCYSGDKDAVH